MQSWHEKLDDLFEFRQVQGVCSECGKTLKGDVTLCNRCLAAEEREAVSLERRKRGSEQNLTSRLRDGFRSMDE